MNVFIKIYIGFTDKLIRLYSLYKQQQVKELLGATCLIQYPFHISGVNNIIAGDSINIGRNSCIMTTRAKLIIKGHFVSGPRITIITGDHMPIVGKYLDTVTDEDKILFDRSHQYDQDVIIEEDVWCGANVTILKGVTIGRGCIIGSGSVVTKSIPPYSIAAGVPCKVIKQKWTLDQIKEHEKLLEEYSSRVIK